MPTFPTTPAPQSVSVLPFRRDAFVSQFSGGAIATRAKYRKRRVVDLQLTYLLTNDELMTLLDFWEDVAGPVLTFDFTYPYPHTVINATDAAPIVITTFYGHGLETGEQVTVAGVNATANGTRTITRLSRTTFSLDGTVGGGGGTSGTIARYFPTMRFSQELLGPFVPTPGYGAPADNNAVIPVVLVLEEV